MEPFSHDNAVPPYIEHEPFTPRSRWHLAIEMLCHGMAFVMPWLLRPAIYGALPSEQWRLGALAALAITFFATGACVRFRWPLAWIPACALTAVFAVVTSPWHVLTVTVAALELLVAFATQAWPNLDSRGREMKCSLSGTGFLVLVGAFIAVGFAILRMSVLAGFPLSLAQALPAPRVALVYLRDNPHALSERPPGDIPWALYSAKHADPIVLEAILGAGAPMRDYDWNGLGSPLAWYAANADLSDRDLLVKARLLRYYGAPADGAAVAARRGSVELARVLLDLGDDVNAVAPNGTTPLGDLIEENAVAAVGALLGCGVKLRPPYGELAKARLLTVPSDAMREMLNRYGQDTSPRLR